MTDEPDMLREVAAKIADGNTSQAALLVRLLALVPPAQRDAALALAKQLWQDGQAQPVADAAGRARFEAESPENAESVLRTACIALGYAMGPGWDGFTAWAEWSRPGARRFERAWLATAWLALSPEVQESG